MDLQPLSEMLDEMLAEAASESDEAVLAQSAQLGVPANPAIVHEYDRRYDEAVRAMESDLGPPEPGPGADSSAEWPAADRLACWDRGDGLVYVALVRQEGAILILAGVRPRPVKPQTITLRPPGD